MGKSRFVFTPSGYFARLYQFLVREPQNHRNFDTMRIKVAVLTFCLNALISRFLGLLRCLLPSKTIAHRRASPQRYRMAVGWRLLLGLPFDLRAIVPYLQVKTNSYRALIGRKVFARNRI